MFLLAKYGVQMTLSFPMVKRGVVDLAVSADWTPATGDTKISKDQGAIANTTNNPSIISGSAIWTLVLTATEMQAGVVDIQIVDSATKAVEDQFIKIYTFGNASAKIPLDLSINQTGDSFARLGSPAGASVVADIATRASQASVDTMDDFLDTEVAAIKAKTDLLPEGIKKNQAFNNFMFMMLDSTTGLAKTGIANASFTKKISIDGATPTNLSGTITEVDATNMAGWYKISFTAEELNGDNIALRFAATGAKDTELSFKTSP